MPFITDYNNSTNQDFVYRVSMALISTSIAVQAEAGSVANHSARSAYALRVLADPLGFARLMAPAFTVGGVGDLNTTDANLEARASSVFNAYAVQG